MSNQADSADAAPIQSPPGGWPIPQSAYVHVPFCRHRCGYCNFSVVANRDDLVERFLSVIDTELAMLDRPPIETLFIGGGTPTHLSTSQLTRFLGMLRTRFELAATGELTVEANPEDMTDEKLDVLVDHGVNRVSLGVQSFADAKLQTLERGHTGIAAQQTVGRVADRIANVSIDLIFAAPGEHLKAWDRDVQVALSLPIKHLSTYALTFEKGTSFWSRRRRGELASPLEADEVEMYQHVRRATSAAGMPQYEISSFSRESFQCRHNLAYWRGRGWYAAGPGGASFVAGQRKVNHRSTTTYLRRIESGRTAVAESESITTTQYARERAAFGVRMMAGVDFQRLSLETGIDLQSECRLAIETCQTDGLIEESGGFTRLTDRGVLFADTVASQLLG